MPQRLDDLRMVDPVLTTIAQGYSNAGFIAENLFPVVNVPKMKGKAPVFGKEAFVVRDTSRSVRANSNRIAPSDFELVDFETQEKDVETAIDYLEEEEARDYSRYEQKLVKDLQDIIALGREKEAADFVQDSFNYGGNQVTTMGAGDEFSNYSNTVDPIEVIKDSMSSLRSVIARYPNIMLMGDDVYQALLQHPKILSRIQYGGISNANKAILSELTGIDAIHVGLAVYSNDGETFSDIWNDSIILAYVDKNEALKRSEFNPSFGYTFRRQGMPEVDYYFENGGKMKVIRATDNYCIKVTAPEAAYLINNLIA